jgi:hypothetical protein
MRVIGNDPTRVIAQIAWRRCGASLEHRTQNLKQIFAARMIYLKVLEHRAENLKQIFAARML